MGGIAGMNRQQMHLLQLQHSMNAQKIAQVREAERTRLSMFTYPQITRPARRLYVGNLPIILGLSEQILFDFFTHCCTGKGITTKNPVVSVWLSNDKTFGVWTLFLFFVCFFFCFFF